MVAQFDAQQAYARNLGWLSSWEQSLLRDKKVAIAGLGGVGGAHLLALTRLGIGKFHIADLDTFEVANFNRQAGGMMSNVGRTKVEAMAEAALDINPTLKIERFEQGVSLENVDAFLEGVDLYVDGLDTFAMEARRAVFKRCAELGIWAITAAPLGMSAAYVSFRPGGMTFEDYFQMENESETGKVMNLLLGVAPQSGHQRYLVDPSTIDLENRKVPSTGAACQLCAGVVATESLKILLNRGEVESAPFYHQFDAYNNSWKRGKLRFGLRTPLQKVRKVVLQKLAAKLKSDRPPAPEPSQPTEMGKIMDLARWAPSGDNGQPWRFEIIDDREVHILLRPPSWDFYDLTGHGTTLSGGFLLETLRSSASRFGRSMSVQIGNSSDAEALSRRCAEADGPDGESADPALGRDVLLIVRLTPDATIESDARSEFIEARSVDRRRYLTTPLTHAQKKRLTACLHESLEIRFFESFTDRLRVVRWNAEAADIVLRAPESFHVHKKILDFSRDKSPTAIPAKAAGVSRVALAALEWSLGSEERSRLLTRMTGTGAARMEMTVIPGLSCGAHFMIALKEEADLDTETLLRVGESVQRVWLEATRLGLSVQPGYAPIALGRYADQETRFTCIQELQDKSHHLARGLEKLWTGQNAKKLVFSARIGVPVSRAPQSRSVRRPLAELMVPAETTRKASADKTSAHKRGEPVAARSVRQRLN